MYNCIFNIFITFQKAVTIPVSLALSAISPELIFHLINFLLLFNVILSLNKINGKLNWV